MKLPNLCLERVRSNILAGALLISWVGAADTTAAAAVGAEARQPETPAPEGRAFEPGEPPPFGPPGFVGPGGPGGPMSELKLVKRFDKDGDKRLDAEERKAARVWLTGTRQGRGAFPTGRGPGRPGREQGKPEAGRRLTPAEVRRYPDAPVYAEDVLRTLFLEFEDADWEKELADFYNTDVEVPARLTVDGHTYTNVGVHFRGMSSFMMVGEGWKRSLNLSLDWVNKDQNWGGYRTLNLLNAHGDPTFLRTVLFCHIAREYLPAPKANFVRLVINGECWGVYVNVQQFNKDFVREWFGTDQGARWKASGSPGARAGLEYLGENPAPYRERYEIKTKDDAAVWAEFIRLCRVLNQTPTNELERALEALLDVDGALKFLALDNVFANGDGYWARASDYNLYLDPKGRFHIIPHDVNETFGAGGPPGGPGGPPGPGGPGGFGPAAVMAGQMIEQGDGNADGRLSKEEFARLAESWFDRLDPDRRGTVSQAEFVERFDQLLPPPPGLGPPAGPAAQPGQSRGARTPGFGPGRFLGPAFFGSADANRDGTLTRSELAGTFANWFARWDAAKQGMLDEENLGAGLATVLPRPEFRGPRGPGGAPGPAFPGGRPPGVGAADLDPLVAAGDSTKPLYSRLLAVPSLRARYLTYVRSIAEKWLDWDRLGPLAMKYRALIADEVKQDTKKLASYEAFEAGIAGEASDGPARGPDTGPSLKWFAAQRRAYLLNHPAVQAAGRER